MAAEIIYLANEPQQLKLEHKEVPIASWILMGTFMFLTG